MAAANPPARDRQWLERRMRRREPYRCHHQSRQHLVASIPTDEIPLCKREVKEAAGEAEGKVRGVLELATTRDHIEDIKPMEVLMTR